MTIILILIGVSLLVFSVWNLISLKQLTKNSLKKDKQLNDAKYYELKYKSEFIIAVFSIVVTVAGILGYNSLNSAKNEIKSDLLTKTKSIDSVIIITEKRIKEKDSILAQIEYKQDLISSAIPLNEQKINAQNSQINKIQNIISDLNNNNKVKQSFYLVRDFVLEEDKDLYATYKFKNLKTSIGDKLPDFVKKPYIIPIPESAANVKIYDITLEGFSVLINSFTPTGNTDEPEVFKFSVMIIENK